MEFRHLTQSTAVAEAQATPSMPWRGSTDHVRLVATHPERGHGQVHDVETGSRDTSLLGRSHERAVIDRLVREARGGQSGVLVLRGEPGVGKTALVDYAVDRAHGFAVARAFG